MPGFMSSMGRISKRAMVKGLRFGDKMLANRGMAYAGMAAGAAAFMASRSSNNRFIRGAGDIAGLGALGAGGLMATRGMGLMRGGVAGAASAAAAAGPSMASASGAYGARAGSALRGSRVMGGGASSMMAGPNSFRLGGNRVLNL